MMTLWAAVKEQLFRQEPAHLKTGKWGEKVASKFLRKKGYRIIETRARVGRRDEIDLVAQQDGTLVFVEVKTRSKASAFRPAAAVNHRKQKALTRAASTYISRMKTKPDKAQFDVIEVIGTPDGDPEIHHLERAFKMNRYRSMKW